MNSDGWKSCRNTGYIFASCSFRMWSVKVFPASRAGFPVFPFAFWGGPRTRCLSNNEGSFPPVGATLQLIMRHVDSFFPRNLPLCYYLFLAAFSLFPHRHLAALNLTPFILSKKQRQQTRDTPSCECGTCFPGRQCNLCYFYKYGLPSDQAPYLPPGNTQSLTHTEYTRNRV